MIRGVLALSLTASLVASGIARAEVPPPRLASPAQLFQDLYAQVGGGEYPLQDGFGWTNGVTRALLDRRTMGRP